MATSKSWFIIDVETSGPAPGLYSMLSLGGVMLTQTLEHQFYIEFQPLPESKIIPEAMKVNKLDIRDLQQTGNLPAEGMKKLEEWVNHVTVGKPVFVSDNPAFDFSFVNYYFALTNIVNPFGFSARRIGDLYAGTQNDVTVSSEWKKYRTTVHNHNAKEDAISNAEALLEIDRLHIPILSQLQ